MTGRHSREILYLHRTQGGGVEQVHILGIASAFEASGASVDIFSPNGLERPSSLKMPVAHAPAKKKKSVLSLISKHAPEFLFELLEIAYNLLAGYRLWKMDAKPYCLLFERYSIFSAVGAIWAKHKKIPLVVEINYTSRSPLVRPRNKLLKPLARMVDQWVFDTATLLTPVSTTLKDELIQEFGISPGKILVLPNAADPAQFLPRTAHSFADLPKTIGFIGGFYPWHGLELLVNAFSGIAAQFPHSQVLLIGDGPELEKIRLQVNRLGLDGRVNFGGRKKHEELPQIMSSFYIGVMPDSNEYGSPMKIFEYMALGIPVVAPQYQPIQDVITSGEQGLLFKKQDVTALALALTNLLEDEALAARMGAAGRQSVENDRNWNANVSRIMDRLIQLDAGFGRVNP